MSKSSYFPRFFAKRSIPGSSVSGAAATLPLAKRPARAVGADTRDPGQREHDVAVDGTFGLRYSASDADTVRTYTWPTSAHSRLNVTFAAGCAVGRPAQAAAVADGGSSPVQQVVRANAREHQCMVTEIFPWP